MAKIIILLTAAICGVNQLFGNFKGGASQRNQERRTDCHRESLARHVFIYSFL